MLAQAQSRRRGNDIPPLIFRGVKTAKRVIMVACSICGKTVKGVHKQMPDMPNGVKGLYPASHICKDGKRYQH